MQSLVLQAPAAWRHLVERGYDITFAAGTDTWAGEGLPGRCEPLPLARRISVADSVAASVRLRQLSRGGWDLVQLQSPVASALYRAVAVRGSSPVLYVAHGFHFQSTSTGLGSEVFRLLESRLASRTTAIAVVAEEDFAAARTHDFGRRSLVWRLPGAGVDDALFRPGVADRCPDAHDKPGTVVFCGDLNANKDPLFAVQVFEAMREARVVSADTRLVMVGHGPLHDRLPHDAGWFEHRARMGAPELAELLRSARLLLAPSWREGLPRVVIEALMCGTPVLARSNRGTRELLNAADDCGRLVTSMTPSDWVPAAVECLSLSGVDVNGPRAMAPYTVSAFVRSYDRLLTALEAPGPAPLRGYVGLEDQ